MRRRGFTLIELLVVITIVAMLMLLLLPAFSRSWDVATLTQCRTNLQRLYQAENTFRADKQTDLFTPDRCTSPVTGVNWSSELKPYVDDCQAVLMCPAAALVRDQGVVGGIGGGSANVNDAGGEASGEQVVFPEDVKLSFQITYRDGHTDEVYPITAALDGSSAWAKKLGTAADGYTQWGVEDNLLLKVGSNERAFYDDILFNVKYENGMPVSWYKPPQVPMSEHYSPGLFFYTLLVNDQMVIKDFYDNGTTPVTTATTANKFPQSVFGVATNYGLSKGTFYCKDGVTKELDSKLILLLDYPKILADYNHEGADDDWPRFFVDETSVKAWLLKYGPDCPKSMTWHDYTALRHFGQANVLFCDGHIATLARDDLAETNGWWYVRQ